MSNKSEREVKKHTRRSPGYPLKTVLVGEGGQGIQTIAKILTQAAFEHGYHASYIPNFGTEQRGGLSLSFIQISRQEIISPKFKTADLFIITSDRNIDRVLQYIGPLTYVLYDADLITPDSAKLLSDKSKTLFPVHVFNNAITSFTERSFNIVLLGIMTGLVDAELKKLILRTMKEKFASYYKKDPKLEKINEFAFLFGLNSTQP